MNIIKSEPPMFDLIDAAFHVKGKAVLFCFGDDIYNPLGVAVSKALVAHENVHRIQQNGSPLEWWSVYIRSPVFRLAQEIPAHHAEYKEYCAGQPNRNLRRAYLSDCARRLSSALYGGLISKDEAKRAIKGKPGEARLVSGHSPLQSLQNDGDRD